MEEFLIADFGENISLAFDTAKEIITNIFNQVSTKLITMYFIRINPRDKWVK